MWNMKTQNHHMLRSCFFFLIVVFMLASCSSPERDARKIAHRYADKINDFSSCKTIADFKALHEQAVESIKESYFKAESKYKADEGTWNLFTYVYQKEMDSANAQFLAVYTPLVDSVLSMREWHQRTDVENGYHLFAFANDTMRIINCKKGVPYTLKGDTITFKDENNTQVIVSAEDSTLIFSSLKSEKQCTFNTPTLRSKFFGQWTMQYYVIDATITFYPSGKSRVYAKRGYNKVDEYYTWTVKENKLRFLSQDYWDSYTFISDNHIRDVDRDGATWNFYRLRKATPQNIEDVLFE